MPNLGKSGQNILTKLEDKEGVKVVISSKVQCDQIEKLPNLGKSGHNMAKISSTNLKTKKV
jgi:hypothetical protein